jgi:hypothetical protein
MAVRAKARSSELYEQDLYAWSRHQAELLHRGRFAELDLEHVVEEIEDVGGSLYREVRSRVRTLMEHLLKLEHSAATEPRAGWERTIRRERADLAEDLTPSLRPRIERNLARFYEAARTEAAAALPRPRRASGRRRPPDHLPLHARSNYQRLAAGPSGREGSKETFLTCLSQMLRYSGVAYRR